MDQTQNVCIYRSLRRTIFVTLAYYITVHGMQLEYSLLSVANATNATVLCGLPIRIPIYHVFSHCHFVLAKVQTTRNIYVYIYIYILAMSFEYVINNSYFTGYLE